MNVEFHNFIRLWYRTGCFRRSTAELLDIAEAAGVEIEGDNLRARWTRLGILVAGYAGQPIVVDGRVLIIRRAGPTNGRLSWNLVSLSGAVEGLKRKVAKIPVRYHSGEKS
jgi:hypothetical protein